jgi:glycosyltransferase involved in cell wall biosynthesis
MIRIAHVAPQLETGGMERLLVDFARRADRRRFELRFIALESGGPIAREIEACGWPVEVLGVRPGVRPMLVPRLARLFSAGDIDVVHTHNTKSLLYAGPSARLAGASAVVHSRHGLRSGASPRQTTLFRWASRCADKVVCVSNAAAACSRAEGVRPAAITTIWNGIDLERFAKSAPTPDGPAVFVGRLTPDKNVETLLKAMAIVRERDRGVKLLIAGDGPSATSLRALCSDLKLENFVEFLGAVSDVPALLAGASMMVLPSRTEGLPLSVLEAMASGVPVIATRVGGTAEALGDGEAGILVQPGNAAALAAEMLRLRKDRALSFQLANAGHHRARRWFGVDTMVARYESLYEDILAERGRPGVPSVEHRRAA